MKVAVVAATGALNYTLLDKKLNSLIESSGCYLFTILCGYVDGNKSKEESLGETWAKRNGAPIDFIHAKSVDKLIDMIILKADYAIFILDGNPVINQAFMRYKMADKRGSVIYAAGLRACH